MPRPSRKASTNAAAAIASDAYSDSKSIEEQLDDLLGEDEVNPPVSSKRKRPAAPTSKSNETKKQRAALSSSSRDEDDHFSPPSSSAHSEDEIPSEDDDLSSAPPSPQPKPKRARKTPVKTEADSIATSLPYEYELTSGGSTNGAAAADEEEKTPAKPKRAPRKKKEPEPELDEDGKPIVGEDGQVVMKTPKKGGGRKKVKEVVIYDVPEVEKLQTSFKGRLGYACLNSLLRNAPTPIFCSRTVRLATFLSETGRDKLVEITQQNTADLITIIKWNIANNIFLFRLSSEMFPFASHKQHGYRLSSLPLAYANLQEAGRIAREHNMRITVHPGQWTQLASPREVVVENAILELEYQCEMLDAMGIGTEGVMVIHMGGVYGDKESTLERFKTNYKTLVPDKVKQRLVLENDEICYNVDDLLPICREFEIPLVFDYHHDWINPSSLPVPLLMPQILDTWKVRGGVRVKQHLSEPRKGAVTLMEKRGHADRCKSLPLSLQEGLAIVERESANKVSAAIEGDNPSSSSADEVKKEQQEEETVKVVGEDGKEVQERVLPEFGIRMGLPDDVDLMIEAKDKEQAVLHLYNLYNLEPVHRGSYLPPNPELEYPDSSDSGEDEGAAELDDEGNPIKRKEKKEGKVLTPMAKAKRAKAKAKALAARKRLEKAAEKKVLDAEKQVVKERKAAERAEKDALKAAQPVKKRGGGRKGVSEGEDLARREAELEKEVELEDELVKMERGDGDASAVESLDRLGSELSELED